MICLLLTVLLPTVPGARQPKKAFRIGYLSQNGAATESIRSEAIRRALHELGYIEGRNIAIEYRYAEGNVDQVPELAAELVRLKIDIIVAAGGVRTIRPAKNATKTISIVMVGAGIDPVVAGVVDSLARPGGNITGVQQPAKFEVVFNLKTAKQIGVTIPQKVLARADKVIR